MNSNDQKTVEEKKDLVVPENKLLPDFITHVCPSCNKLRLLLPPGQSVDSTLIDVETPSKEIIKVMKTICLACKNKVVRNYFSRKADPEKIINALKDINADLKGKSLEELL